METFENNEFFPQEPQEEPAAAPIEQNTAAEYGAAPVEQNIPSEPAAADTPAYTQPVSGEPAPAAYHGAGAGQKESPYANSPYVNYSRPNQEYQTRYHYQPEPPKAKKPAGQHSVWKTLIAAVLTIALVAGGCLITAQAVNSRWEKQNAATVDQLNKKINELQQKVGTLPTIGSGSASDNTVSIIDGMTPGEVYSRNVNSVVAISSTIRASNMFGQVSEGSSSGSGFIITADGYVVTNYHVIEGATGITVHTYSGDEYPAKVIGTDSTNDVAVLKVEAENLTAATLGSSDNLGIGDMVVAIGNPLGELAATQTVGYVSGKNREVNTDNAVINMIQTDAAINPGNSGGPLFNMKGEVVGITTAKYSGTTSSGASIEGIGFAIPISDVQNIISDLKDLGYVTGAYLGVTVQNTDAQSAAYYGLPTGAYVVSVVEGGSAHRAGVQPKDIIIKLGDYDVGSVTDLTRSLRSFKAGEETMITLIRGGQQLELKVTLDEKPQTITSPADSGLTGEMPDEGNYEDWYEFFSPFFEEGRSNRRGK